MKVRILLAVALLAVPVSALAVPAVQLPAVQLTIEGVPTTPTNFTLTYDPAVSPEFRMFGDGSVLVADENVVYSFSANGNTDPFINWSLTLATAMPNPFTVQATFTIPVVGGPYDRVTLSNVQGTLSGQNAAATGVVDTAGLGLGGPPSTVATWPLADCLVSPCNYPTDTALVAVDNYTSMSEGIGFTLEGGLAGAKPLHSAQFSGTLTLDLSNREVPEPSTLLLIGAAFIGLGRARRRNLN